MLTAGQSLTHSIRDQEGGSGKAVTVQRSGPRGGVMTLAGRSWFIRLHGSWSKVSAKQILQCYLHVGIAEQVFLSSQISISECDDVPAGHLQTLNVRAQVDVARLPGIWGCGAGGVGWEVGFSFRKLMAIEVSFSMGTGVILCRAATFRCRVSCRPCTVSRADRNYSRWIHSGFMDHASFEVHTSGGQDVFLIYGILLQCLWLLLSMDYVLSMGLSFISGTHL